MGVSKRYCAPRGAQTSTAFLRVDPPNPARVPQQSRFVRDHADVGSSILQGIEGACDDPPRAWRKDPNLKSPNLHIGLIDTPNPQFATCRWLELFNNRYNFRVVLIRPWYAAAMPFGEDCTT